MKYRRYWVEKIENEWERRSLLWLSGVRRSGKTVLSQTLEDVQYFDCELPRIRRQMEDAERFLESLRGLRIVLDEVHRLSNPSELLKIAADHFTDVKVLATGSSTLQASSKFRDTLTGRKTEIWLTPMMNRDLVDFGNPDISHRMLFGGLPPFFLSDELPEKAFQEWIDSFWAKDVQELFRLEKRYSFAKCLELILANSGGIFEATKYSSPCEISRTTVSNYLSVLEATSVAHIIRPFSKRRSSEIISAPKVYGFDTGFVCYFKGWHILREEDFGYLWEHYVLNELHSRLQTRKIFYWRDKRGHEIDFVLSKPGEPPIAIECKWTADEFDARGLRSFRNVHPLGKNFVVSRDVDRSFNKILGGLPVSFVGIEDLLRSIASAQEKS